MRRLPTAKRSEDLPSSSNRRQKSRSSPSSCGTCVAREAMFAVTTSDSKMAHRASMTPSRTCRAPPETFLQASKVRQRRPVRELRTCLQNDEDWNLRTCFASLAPTSVWMSSKSVTGSVSPFWKQASATASSFPNDFGAVWISWRAPFARYKSTISSTAADRGRLAKDWHARNAFKSFSACARMRMYFLKATRKTWSTASATCSSRTTPMAFFDFHCFGCECNDRACISFCSRRTSVDNLATTSCSLAHVSSTAVYDCSCAREEARSCSWCNMERRSFSA
mmetsp:Transcript_5387/g.17028  ORF Transcript_5387/g.17028 Transcript_5387/m.17028 type:complete len:280 (+) Transcript_5387:320-1159(+)